MKMLNSEGPMMDILCPSFRELKKFFLIIYPQHELDKMHLFFSKNQKIFKQH